MQFVNNETIEEWDKHNEENIKRYNEFRKKLLQTKESEKLAFIINTLKNLATSESEEAYSSMIVKETLRLLCEIDNIHNHLSDNELEKINIFLIKKYLAKDELYINIAKNYIKYSEINEIVQKRIITSPYHSGMIGGKSAGLLLAYKILMNSFEDLGENLYNKIKIPDSYFISTDVFDYCIKYNKLEYLYKHKYKNREEIDKDYPNIYNKIMNMKIPHDILEIYKRLLSEELNNIPLILRSSNFLEDNFNASFSGKYESYFIANIGDLDKRLEEFTTAIKKVYASTFAPDPLIYRMKKGLTDYSEQMSILVQKVVGKKYNNRYFFPLIGGVGFSHNSYCWSKRLKKEDGILRFALGLGTRAVDRTGSDYPRMVSLTIPKLRPEIDLREIRRYSQNCVDVLDLEKNEIVSLMLHELLNQQDPYSNLHLAISIVNEGILTTPATTVSLINANPKSMIITFDRLLESTDFPDNMKKILKTLEKYYHYPVDIEYVFDGEIIYFLQCRPLAHRKATNNITIPKEIEENNILFTMNKNLTTSITSEIEYVIYVAPDEYLKLPKHSDMTQVARLVGKINDILEYEKFILMGPGRWGSSDILLGVPVRYMDINNTKMLIEIARSIGSYTPEVSLGTHFFQDLVEAEIIPLPLYPDNHDIIFNESFLMNSKNLFAELIPDYKQYENCIRVIHIPSEKKGNYLNIIMSEEEGKGVAYFTKLNTK